MKQAKYYISNENFYFLYLSDPGLAINSNTEYFLHKRNGESFKHVESKIQMIKCLDLMDGLNFYGYENFKFNKTNIKFRKLKYQNSSKQKDIVIKINKKNSQVLCK
jgi:hypothetical protein